MKTSILLTLPGVKGSFCICVMLLYWAFNYLSGISTKFCPKSLKKNPNNKIALVGSTCLQFTKTNINYKIAVDGRTTFATSVSVRGSKIVTGTQLWH